MKTIWAPWRIEYILSEKPDYCIFCNALEQKNDAKTFTLYHGKHSFVIMNTFPYNNGHLMIAPYQHQSCPTKLDQEIALEIHRMTQESIRILRSVLNAEGFNIGMNLGKVAGAGVEDHVHTHIVPRWNGDTNFMPVIGDTKVFPEYLKATYDKLLPGFEAIRDGGS